MWLPGILERGVDKPFQLTDFRVNRRRNLADQESNRTGPFQNTQKRTERETKRVRGAQGRKDKDRDRDRNRDRGRDTVTEGETERVRGTQGRKDKDRDRDRDE